MNITISGFFNTPTISNEMFWSFESSNPFIINRLQSNTLREANSAAHRVFILNNPTSQFKISQLFTSCLLCLKIR